MSSFDVIVIGAGAAGLMAAATAGRRGRKVLLLERSDKIAEKIRISGGGKCNFTNLHASPANYISANAHFAISALKRYTQEDFLKLVESYNIKYYEKTLGQLFCCDLSTRIINMLLNECEVSNVQIVKNCIVHSLNKTSSFNLQTSIGDITGDSLIISTGGLSIPKLGATDFGYQVASQFGLNIITPLPALVPLTVQTEDLEFFKSLSGISIPSIVKNEKIKFEENILFTHRGLSGPAILQISSYLAASKSSNIHINLLPNINLLKILDSHKYEKILLSNLLKNYLPNRFVDNWASLRNIKRLVDYTPDQLKIISDELHEFKISIADTEGYSKAEVTLGGVNTNELSSKTMESKKIPGLYFIGEVVDVTGWLGGYNFQWAWSSGFAAGSYA